MKYGVILSLFLTACASSVPSEKKQSQERAPSGRVYYNPSCGCNADYPQEVVLTAVDFKDCQSKNLSFEQCETQKAETPRSKNIIPTVMANGITIQYKPVNARKECVKILKAIVECQQDIREGAEWSTYFYSL